MIKIKIVAHFIQAIVVFYKKYWSDCFGTALHRLVQTRCIIGRPRKTSAVSHI
jgi:hypothetical protein